MAAAALYLPVPGAMDRHAHHRDREPGSHRVDSADDQGRHRRPGAPPGPAGAVGPRACRDRCRYHRGRAVVPAALADLARHHGGRGRYPQGPLRTPADPADVVPRALAVGPVAVANHERPELDSPVHVVRHGLPIAQHAADRRGHRHPAGDVLAAWCRRRGLDRARHLDGAAFPAPVCHGSRRTSPAMWPPMSRSPRSACG